MGLSIVPPASFLGVKPMHSGEMWGSVCDLVMVAVLPKRRTSSGQLSAEIDSQSVVEPAVAEPWDPPTEIDTRDNS